MKISAGSDHNGSPCIAQCSPLISSKLLVSKRPSGVTTAHVPSLKSMNLQRSLSISAFASMSQIRAVPSSPPENTNLSSLEAFTELTLELCPLSVRISTRFSKFHNPIVPSVFAAINKDFFGTNEIALTPDWSRRCTGGTICAPVSAFQTQMAPLQAPATTDFLSGE